LNNVQLTLLNRLRAVPWKSLPAWLSGDRLHILMYHSISENQHDPHAISLTEFTYQLRSLQGARVISLEEGLRLLRDKRPLKNTWVITFDDALLDFYTTALPVLKEFNFPVTMFVPTGLVGTNSIWDSYDNTKLLMNWAQLEECQQWNITFGSHTASHAKLTECADEVLMNELQISLRTLQKRLKSVIPAIAYPGGYHNDRVRKVTRSAGYACALGASSRWGNGPESDLFQLRRERFHQ